MHTRPKPNASSSRIPLHRHSHQPTRQNTARYVTHTAAHTTQKSDRRDTSPATAPFDLQTPFSPPSLFPTYAFLDLTLPFPTCTGRLVLAPLLNLLLASPTVGTFSSFISTSALVARLRFFLTGFLYVAR